MESVCPKCYHPQRLVNGKLAEHVDPTQVDRRKCDGSGQRPKNAPALDEREAEATITWPRDDLGRPIEGG